MGGSKVKTSQPVKRSPQLEYIQRMVLRTLWRNPKSLPFREPVDPERHNAPGYFDVITTPMDFGTIRSKLLNDKYNNSDECVADFRLVFDNCYKYNSEGLPIYEMCKSLEVIFNEKMTNLPQDTGTLDTNEDTASWDDTKLTETSVADNEEFVASPDNSEFKPIKSKKLTKRVVKEGGKPPLKKKKSVEEVAEPAVQPEEVPEPTQFKRDSRRSSVSQTFLESNQIESLPNTSEALNYCYMIVNELFSRKHSDYAWPYYEPVDTKAPSLVDYPSVIHYPTDLSSIKQKIQKGMYGSSFECISEMRRMISNSFRYNPEGHTIHEMGRKLSYAIDILIAKAPPEVFDSLIFFTGTSYNLAAPDTIHSLEEKVQKMVAEMNDMKSKKKNKKAKSKYTGDSENSHDDDYVNPIAAKSQPSSSAILEIEHAEPMTYDEKRKLSMDINMLPPDKLGNILGLICQLESSIVTEKNSSEVEIDFDRMKSETLRKLEQYVKYLNKPVKKKKKPPAKSNGTVLKSETLERQNGHTDNFDSDIVGNLALSEDSSSENLSDEQDKDFYMEKVKEQQENRPYFVGKNPPRTATLDDSLIPESMLNCSKNQNEQLKLNDISKAVEQVKQQKKLFEEESRSSEPTNLGTPLNEENDEPLIEHSNEEIQRMKREQQEKRLALASKTKTITTQSDLMASYKADL